MMTTAVLLTGSALAGTAHAQGAEFSVAVSIQQNMEAVGHTIHVVCPDKNEGHLIETSLHDFEGDLDYTEKPGHFAEINKTFSEAEAELDSYDAVYCAGGRGPDYIRTDPRIRAMVRHLHEAGKPIFTICHGVQIRCGARGAEGSQGCGSRSVRS